MPLVIGACVTLWVVTLLMSGSGIGVGGMMSALSPSTDVLFLFGASGAIPVFRLRPLVDGAERRVAARRAAAHR